MNEARANRALKVECSMSLSRVYSALEREQALQRARAAVKRSKSVHARMKRLLGGRK